VAEPTLRKLTLAELTHSLHDLLGDVTVGPVEPDTDQDGFFSVGAAQVAISPSGVAKYEQVFDAATAAAFADPSHVASILACVPKDTADETCLRSAITAFGRKAWRRPLVEAEVARYLDVAVFVGGDAGDVLEGLRHAVWGMLESPNFLYRVELGEASAAGRLEFTPYELASRLSYTLWSTLPDDALLDAAADGSLSTPEGLHDQAKRMLADPRARQGVANFVSELYGLWRLESVFKDATLYPSWTPTLPAAMREDFLRRITDVVFDDPGDFLSLYDGRKAFVNNELAKLYGLPEEAVDGFRSAELPADGMRRGLIGSGAVLAMYSLPQRTSATERGKFIAEAMLCKTIPPPPPNVDTKLADDPAIGPQTLRQKLEPHRANPACAGCHGMMDPLGLALENFDTVGAFRDNDHGLPIDATGEVDGAPFQDAAGLAARLREHPEVAGCLVKKLATFTAGRAPVSSEEPGLAELRTELDASGNRFDELLLALVTSDDFVFAQPPRDTP